MDHVRRTFPTMSALVWLVAAAACGSGSGDAANGSIGGRRILRIAYLREIDVLNPFTSQNLVDIEFSMMEGLVTTDDHNSYVPVLAKEIPTEENGLVTRRDDGTVAITWPLHSGVRWHDGAPFTSADVCFTWRFVSSPGSQTYNRDQYLGIKACDTPDDTTVVFTWDGLYGYYDGLFEAVLPEHVFRGMSTDQIVNDEGFNRGRTTLGTGPFRLAEWKSGEYIRVVRNDDYWRGAEYPRIDEIVWSFIPDDNTRLNAIKSGGYHWSQIQPVQVKDVAHLPGYHVHLISSNSVMHLDLNVGTPHGRLLFGDPAVRRALFHAIDRRAIADQLMEGTVALADTPLNPTSPYHDESVQGYAFDPSLARRMLDAAGWWPGRDGVRTKEGQRFSFTLLNRAGSADRTAVGQVIQAQLRDVGIEVGFETLESAAWTQRWRTGEWEALVSAWFLSADPSLTSLYQCDGPNNMTGMCDPGLDSIMEASDRRLDFAGRKPLLNQVQERLHDDAFTLPIYYNVVPEVVSDAVGNYRGSGTNFGSFWNLWEWTLR
ncbi:MAG: peptide ABC transporter substrate-binding protein [Gemmatimonadetes bacterium]|nr:peptide ABC transporter substrate-binding protein [Gemmatimonadota bacterium]